ncbi:MAG: hypothetical protein K2L71_09815 [Muribaculaceae bacterium]|nr:hypothetical protein [Muribaculaceae bacterium]
MKKKLLLSAGSMLTIMVAGAVTPMPQPMVQSMKLDHGIKRESLKKVSASEAAVLRAQVYHEYNLVPTYSTPEGAFYGGLFNIDPVTEMGYVSNLVLMPTNTPLTFTAGTAIFATAAPSVPQPEDFVYNWRYFTGKNNGDIQDVEVEARDITLSMPPSLTLYRQIGPRMYWSCDGGNLRDTVLYNVEYGGRLRVGLENTIETIDTWLNPVNKAFYRNEMFDPAMAGTKIADQDNNMTYSQLCEAYGMNRYSKAYENTFGEALKTVSIDGFVFNLGYAGQPYALGGLDLYAVYQASKGGTLSVNLVKLDEKGMMTDEIVATSSITVNASNKEVQGPLHVDFYSVNADEEEVAYMIIDAPMAVLISGFDDFEAFIPFSSAYDATAATTWGVRHNGATLYHLAGETTDASIVSEFDQSAIYISEDGKFVHFLGFYVKLDVEYPVLEPVSYVIDYNDENPEGAALMYFDHQDSNSYAVDLAEGETTLDVQFASSCEYADEIFIDDIDLPEWLDCAAYDMYSRGELLSSNSGEYLYYNGLGLLFTVNDGKYENRYGKVTLQYMNQTVEFYVGQNGAANAVGLDKVEAAADGAVEYFDVQGRKLQSAPANGFFLQRQGNKVTKVIR